MTGDTSSYHCQNGALGKAWNFSFHPRISFQIYIFCFIWIFRQKFESKRTEYQQISKFLGAPVCGEIKSSNFKLFTFVYLK